MIGGAAASGVFTVTGSHTYAAEGCHTLTTRIHHEGAADATATGSALIQRSIIEPPPPPPPPVRGIRAQLAPVKVGKKWKRVVQVLFTDTGAPERQFDAPFQNPKFKGITVSVQAATGKIVVSARKGKKSCTRTFPG
jgi:hypothetical protein